jgi:hypothetical protein
VTNTTPCLPTNVRRVCRLILTEGWAAEELLAMEEFAASEIERACDEIEAHPTWSEETFR